MKRQTQIQLCIVLVVRHILNNVSWKRRKEVSDDLKTIYHAPTVELAQKNLDAFAATSHSGIAKSWQNHWERIIPIFSYPTDICKAIYTTNGIESLNMSLRKVTKNRGHFPSGEAVFKLIYLVLINIAKKWTMPISRLEVFTKSI